MSVNVTSLHCIGPYFYTGPPSFASSSISYFFRCLSLPFPSFTMLLTISFYCQLCLSSSPSHIPPTRVVATIFLNWIGMNHETSIQSIHFILIPFFSVTSLRKAGFRMQILFTRFLFGFSLNPLDWREGLIHKEKTSIKCGKHEPKIKKIKNKIKFPRSITANKFPCV